MLSIIVAWCDRVELSQALPNLRQAARVLNGDLTIVNYGGNRDWLKSQLSETRGLYPVHAVHVSGERYFNKSRAQNIGAHSTQHPLLFFCDCDIILEPELVRSIVVRLNDSDSEFATLAGVRETELNSRGGRHVVSFGYELDIRTADGRRLRIVDNEEDAENGTRQAPGLLFVRRPDFLAINGYNSALHGWGWEDQDMISRLTLGLGLTRLTQGHALHVSHDDSARIANYPPVKDRWESRDRMFRAALANYDAQNFRGTYEEDTHSIKIDRPSQNFDGGQDASVATSTQLG